jgi:hypothetical protein
MAYGDRPEQIWSSARRRRRAAWAPHPLGGGWHVDVVDEGGGAIRTEGGGAIRTGGSGA